MFKNLILLFLFSISFSSCTIVGNYYLINSSKNKIKVSLTLDPSFILLGKKVEIKSLKKTKKKVKFSAFKKMKTHPYTIDSLTSTLHFELDSEHLAYLGTNYNTRKIGDIKIVENKNTFEFDDSNQGKFKSRGLMKYVMLYKYE